VNDSAPMQTTGSVSTKEAAKAHVFVEWSAEACVFSVCCAHFVFVGNPFSPSLSVSTHSTKYQSDKLHELRTACITSTTENGGAYKDRELDFCCSHYGGNALIRKLGLEGRG